MNRIINSIEKLAKNFRLNAFLSHSLFLRCLFLFLSISMQTNATNFDDQFTEYILNLDYGWILHTSCKIHYISLAQHQINCRDSFIHIRFQLSFNSCSNPYSICMVATAQIRNGEFGIKLRQKQARKAFTGQLFVIKL